MALKKYHKYVLCLHYKTDLSSGFRRILAEDFFLLQRRKILFAEYSLASSSALIPIFFPSFRICERGLHGETDTDAEEPVPRAPEDGRAEEERGDERDKRRHERRRTRWTWNAKADCKSPQQ